MAESRLGESEFDGFLDADTKPSHGRETLSSTNKKFKKLCTWSYSAMLLVALTTLAVVVAVLATADTAALRTQAAESISVTAALDGEGAKESLKYMQISPCGNTAPEAQQRGCNFDIMSFSWLPNQCYDATLSDEFDNFTTWEWFLDPNKTRPVTHAEVMTGEYTGLYVNWQYHIRHCTAMWLKMHRAIIGAGKSAIDSYIGELHHTRHCSDMLLTHETELDVINTVIRVKFPHCGML